MLDPNHLVGIMFRNVILPRYSRVASAYIEVCAGNTTFSTSGSKATVMISADATMNPLPFEGVRRSKIPGKLPVVNRYDDVNKRPWTVASVQWSIANWKRTKLYRTPDLTDIIKELSYNDVWNEGNRMAFMIDTDVNSSPQYITSYENKTDTCPPPTLHILWALQDQDSSCTDYEGFEDKVRWETRKHVDSIK